MSGPAGAAKDLREQRDGHDEDKREFALDESPGDKVELAVDHRIGTAAGEADEGSVIAGDEHRAARESFRHTPRGVSTCFALRLTI